jgi:hypothetical protein
MGDFEPFGGMPPIMLITEKNAAKNIMSPRGFATTNFVKITDIMATKRGDALFALGPDTTEGAFMDELIFSDNPQNYDGVAYKKISFKQQK